MRKMMFLALMLSAMAIGSASANDVERRPAGVMFGVRDNGAFLAVNVGNPGSHKPYGEYRGERDNNKKGARKGNCRKHNNKKKGHKSCNHPKDHHPKPHAGFHKTHRPGTPPPHRR